MKVYITEEAPGRAEDVQTLVQAGRIMSGLTQDQMAEELHIDPRTLRRYESGEAETPDDVMLRISELAGCQMLLYQHFKTKYRIADDMMPGVTELPLAQAAVTLLSELAALEEAKAASRLLALAKDGVIDATEKKDFEFIMEKLDGVVKAVMLLRFAKKE